MSATGSLEHGSVLILGGGAVGELFATSLQQSGAAPVVVVDRRQLALPGVQTVRADVLQWVPGIADSVARSDVVILALPEDVTIEVAAMVLPLLRPHSLLIDTLSVKARFVSALPQSAGGIELLGVNPMFAPSLGFAGRSLIAVSYSTAGRRMNSFMRFVRAQGCEVVQMDVDQHDRACASLQALTHAAILTFGLALQSSELDFAQMEKIAPPPHRALLALLARIAGGEAEIYREIQFSNPHAPKQRAALEQACRNLEGVVASGEPQAFARMLSDLVAVFEGSHNDYRALCAQMFELGSVSKESTTQADGASSADL